MKALSLWQPWATLIAMEQKCIETRCWATKYRGPLAIHSTMRRPPKWLGASAHSDPFRDELADVFNVRRDRDDRCGKHVDDILAGLPYGKVVCIVRLVDICETACMQRDELPMREQIFGNYDDGRYAWSLELLEIMLPPIAAKGNRMLWNWDRP